MGFWWSWAMRWWQRGDCGSDGPWVLWVSVDLGGHGMGCGLVFRSPNPGTELLKCNHMFNLNNLRSMMCQLNYSN